MSLPALTPPPTAPSRSDAPDTFVVRADALLGWLDTHVAEMTAFGEAITSEATATNYNATSATSVAIGTGSKSFTASTGKNFSVGQFVLAASTASPSNYMLGQVTAYNATTGAMTVNVTSVGGSGTFAAWTISLGTVGGGILNTGDQGMSGALQIGSTSAPAAGQNLLISKTLTGAASAYAARQTGVVQATVTTLAVGFQSNAVTAAAAFTLSNFRHFDAQQGVIGAGSAVTNQFGYYAGAGLTGAVNNFGYFGDIPSGAGRWNIYMNGSAPNYMAAGLAIGAAAFIGLEKFRITGEFGTDNIAHFENVSAAGNLGGIAISLGNNGNNTSSYHLAGITQGVAIWYLRGNGTVTYSSDRRIKKNFRAAEQGYFEKFMQIPMQWWNYRGEKKGDPQHFGPVAQDVEKVFPELVRAGMHEIKGQEGFCPKTLDGGDLYGAYLAQAFIELGARHLKLQSDFDELVERVATLERGRT